MTPGDDAGIGKEIEMDIEMLGAGRVLDYFVAERVMGWLWVVTEGKRYLANPECTLPQATGEEPMWQGHYIFVPHYSTDMAAAFSILEHLLTQGHSYSFGHNHEGWFVRIDNAKKVTYTTAPLAICKAALALQAARAASQ
jgi:hypothetical protein